MASLEWNIMKIPTNANLLLNARISKKAVRMSIIERWRALNAKSTAYSETAIISHAIINSENKDINFKKIIRFCL